MLNSVEYSDRAGRHRRCSLRTIERIGTAFGAPVFDERCRLIALHHRAGTLTRKTGKAPLTENQGVRISRVVAGLVAQNVQL